MTRLKTDKRYRLSSLMLIPTNQTISFICRECQVPTEAKIYRDVRDEAIAVSRPNTAHGGIPVGQRYDFVFCIGCQVWYRKNDYLKIRNANIIDPTRLARLDPNYNLTTAFVAGGEFNPANIADEATRIRLQADFDCYDDNYEPSQYIVCVI